MKPKLIILNGPLGIGKTTLMKRYAEDHPLTLKLDIDDVRAMFSDWREKKDESSVLSKDIAISMAGIALKDGRDVVVPQILQTAELADRFKKLAEDRSAVYFEILLLVDKRESVSRFILRGQSEGHPTGFRAGGLVDTGGREKKLEEMYDNMMAVADSRPDMIKIEPKLGDIESTYQELMKNLA